MKARQGRVLIADPHYYSSPPNVLTGEFELDLFDHPILDVADLCLSTKRGERKVGGETEQTGWKHDRNYRLRPILRPRVKRSGPEEELHKQLARLYGQPSDLDERYEQASKLFERLSIDDAYEFTVGCQFTVGTGLDLKRNLTLYVPRTASIVPAITHALTWMTDRWNKKRVKKHEPKPFQFTPQHMQRIVEYVAEDLRTGIILKHNVEAGIAADAMVGFT
ncbi:MAG: hypothetical protein V4481_00635 [Patescibacteria group bacterium]